jgi:hypothetical protein
VKQMELCKVNFRYQGICWYQNGSLAKVQIQFPYIRSQKKKKKRLQNWKLEAKLSSLSLRWGNGSKKLTHVFFNIESAIILCRDGCFAVGVSTVLDGNWQHHCL